MLSDNPLINRIMLKSENAGHVKMIEGMLVGRFGTSGPGISAGLKRVQDEKAFVRLGLAAGTCADLAAFEKALAAELPQPTAPSTRGKRKPKKAE